MAWIESHQELRDHPKTKRLARELNLTVPHAVGLLHCLWWWALDYAQDGNLEKYDPADVADGAGWTGDPADFTRALAVAGFIDTDPDDPRPWSIHDWDDYTGKLMERRERNKERMREARSESVQRTNGARAAHDLPRVQLQNSTQQNHTEPNQTEPTAPDPREAAAAALDDAVAKCCRGWEKATGTTVTAMLGDYFASELKGGFPLDWMHDALVEVGNAGAKSPRYLRAIVDRWKLEGRDEEENVTPIRRYLGSTIERGGTG